MIHSGNMPAPRQVQIDLCNPCTHNCVYCYYTHETRGEEADNKLELFSPRDIIPTKKVFELIDDLKSIGTGCVSYTGGGEPTLHSDFDKIIEYTNRRHLPWSLTTNGSLIHKRRLSELISTASWVRFSMDAAKEDTFNKCQRPTDKNDFGFILTTIGNLCKRPKDSRPIVGLSLVVNPINNAEVYDFIALGKRLGVDNVRISLVYTSKRADIHTPYIESVKEQVEKAKKDFESDDFRIFAMLERYEDLKSTKKSYKFCNFHYFTCAIGADMRIYPCCTTKYLKRFVIGEIKEKKFSDIWFGKEHKDFINTLKVSTCPQCWFDGSNRLIETVLNEGIEHEIEKLDEHGKEYVSLKKEDAPHVDWV